MFTVFGGRSGGHTFRSFMLLCGLAAGQPCYGAALTLQGALDLALGDDPSIQAVEARREALQELAVASEQLPDPVLRMGLVSLPTDTWRLGQEPMTQVQIGLSQRFPRGQSRALRAEQVLEQSRALNESARDQRLRIALAVREEYLEVLKHMRRHEVNAAAALAFSDLAEITQDYYATGRVQQQDVLRAAVELARVEDRALRIAAEVDQARARLAVWIGAPAYGDMVREWPQLQEAGSLDDVLTALPQHPRIAALQRQAEAAETGVELSRQRYKPEFGIDLVYGGRGGNDFDGTSRSDLFSVMVVMDMPLFHSNRQDRYTAASLAESTAALLDRDDLYRRMRSEAALHFATLKQQRERLRLFDESLLPDAGFNAAAALEAYQSALDNLTTLMRARITEFELQLEYAELQAEQLKTVSRLHYLGGERG